MWPNLPGLPLHFCILQAIKNWSQGKPGDDAVWHHLYVLVYTCWGLCNSQLKPQLKSCCDQLCTPNKRFSLPGGNNPQNDLISDVLNSTDSSNLLGDFGSNSTAPPQSQQTQWHLMIDPSTSVPSLRPTTVGMGSPGMIPHGVTHPQATMHPMRPMCSTRWSYPRHGGGGGHYGMMPGGQYVNQVQSARPGGTRMAMGQQHTPPHMVTH